MLVRSLEAHIRVLAGLGKLLDPHPLEGKQRTLLGLPPCGRLLPPPQMGPWLQGPPLESMGLAPITNPGVAGPFPHREIR